MARAIFGCTARALFGGGSTTRPRLSLFGKGAHTGTSRGGPPGAFYNGGSTTKSPGAYSSARIAKGGRGRSRG